jgi:hypothetical protein
MAMVTVIIIINKFKLQRNSSFQTSVKVFIQHSTIHSYLVLKIKHEDRKWARRVHITFSVHECESVKPASVRAEK